MSRLRPGLVISGAQLGTKKKKPLKEGLPRAKLRTSSYLQMVGTYLGRSVPCAAIYSFCAAAVVLAADAHAQSTLPGLVSANASLLTDGVSVSVSWPAFSADMPLAVLSYVTVIIPLAAAIVMAETYLVATKVQALWAAVNPAMPPD